MATQVSRRYCSASMPNKKMVKTILVISERSMLREGLKRLIEETGTVKVITAPDKKSAEHLLAKFVPAVVIIDHPDIQATDWMYFLQQLDQPSKIILLGWNDDKLAVYSHRLVLESTVQNLIKQIRE